MTVSASASPAFFPGRDEEANGGSLANIEFDHDDSLIAPTQIIVAQKPRHKRA
jgi:hypothetical protein